MANLKASKKDIRKTRKRNALNSYQRARLRTLAKKVRHFTEDGMHSEAVQSLAEYHSYLDKAGRRHLIHPGQASRHKSRMTLLVNRTFGQEPIDTTAEAAVSEPVETETTAVESAEQPESTES
ncbi:MAG: 30S ribosomal protein S20 [Leptospiraceae bacterium]|nr:30S ribosomal protein S20 [Leptospiraceae bacterium]